MQAQGLAPDGPRRTAFPTGVKSRPIARPGSRRRYPDLQRRSIRPGSQQDHVVIEAIPSLIEAMTISGYATGSIGYVYLRGEYPQAHAILGAAIAEARRRRPRP